MTVLGLATTAGETLRVAVSGSAGGSRLAVEALLGSAAPGDNPFRPDRDIRPRGFDVL